MSDEETQDILDNNTTDGEDTSEPVDPNEGDTNQDISTEDTPSDDDPTPEPETEPEPNKYCSDDDVNSMFGDISDEITTEMFNTAITNATTWIEANLKRNYVPIPTDHPQALKTVAIYHSASDILLSLYHGDDLPTTYDVWFNKAQSLLDDYIEAYLNADAEEEDLIAHQPVKHSHARTYNQKRKRRGVMRWAR